MIYRQFKVFHARWWGVSLSTLFRVVKWSNTGYSAWLEINGEIRCVPRQCLVDSWTYR